MKTFQVIRAWCPRLKDISSKRITYTGARTYEVAAQEQKYVQDINTIEKDIDFSDTVTSFKSQTNFELVRAWCVLTLCKQHALVEAAEPGRVQSILKWTESIFSKALTRTVIKRTFFDHFCAGEDAKEIAPVLARLRKQEVRGILDYAAKEEEAEGSQSVKARLFVIFEMHNVGILHYIFF